MEWSKAKNILILIYVMVNIFLSMVLGTLYMKRRISEDTLNNTIIALKNRGVLVNCKLSRYNKETGTLSYEKFTIDRKRVLDKIMGKSVIEGQNEYKTKNKEIIFLDDNKLVYKDYTWHRGRDYENDVIRYANSVLQKCNIEFEGEIDERDVNRVTIYEKYEGFCVFGNYVKIDIDGDTVSMEISYRKVRAIDTKKRKIMPIHQVLLKNIVNMEGEIITDIKFGFRESILEDNIKELDDIPVWRVRFNNRDDIFYKAYTGKLVK
ncbi:MAG: two-component system regulatory protein YycI [Clostridiales bacterium]|nr:two-component system regulatory protein YycI [Clostridiales bacterium]